MLKASGTESSDPSESVILIGIAKIEKNTDQIGLGGLTKNTLKIQNIYVRKTFGISMAFETNNKKKLRRFDSNVVFLFQATLAVSYSNAGFLWSSVR